MQAIYKTHRITMDGGISLTLELPSDEADNVNKLYKLNGQSLHVVIMTDQQLNDSKRKKR